MNKHQAADEDPIPSSSIPSYARVGNGKFVCASNASSRCPLHTHVIFSGRFRGPSTRATDEGGFTFSEAPFEGTLHEGLKGASPSEDFKGASPSEEGGFKALEGGFKGLGGLQEGGLKGASRGLTFGRLQGGLKGASRGLEKGLKPSEGEGGFDRDCSFRRSAHKQAMARTAQVLEICIANSYLLRVVT